MRMIGCWSPLTLENGMQCTCTIWGMLNRGMVPLLQTLRFRHFWSYEITSSSDNDLLSSCSLLGNSRHVMVDLDTMCYNMEYFASLYMSEERIEAFWRNIGLSKTSHEKDFNLKACSKVERTNMVALEEYPNPYFYLYLVFIYDLGFLIIFILFEAMFLAIANVAPS